MYWSCINLSNREIKNINSPVKPSGTITHIWKINQWYYYLQAQVFQVSFSSGQKFIICLEEGIGFDSYIGLPLRCCPVQTNVYFVLQREADLNIYPSFTELLIMGFHFCLLGSFFDKALTLCSAILHFFLNIKFIPLLSLFSCYIPFWQQLLELPFNQILSLLFYKNAA